MNGEDIIKMVSKAGFQTGQMFLFSGGEPIPFAQQVGTSCLEELKRFAVLVAAVEREECCKIVEEGTALTAFQSKDCYRYAYNRCNAIRERT